MNDHADSALGQPRLTAGSPSPARMQGSLALDLEMRQGQQGLSLASTPSPLALAPRYPSAGAEE